MRQLHRLVAALVVVLALASVRQIQAPSAETREFRGAYPARIRPSGVVHDVAIRAAPATIPLLDGRPLQVWTYNGQVPGPTIRIRLGDTVRVAFTNGLPQATTIHWHGVRVPNAMDGVPGVTQPPVEPGATFTYEFTPKDPGTYWFHPHLRSSEQVERGLFGVLIVDDPEPRPYSRDVLWVLDDWLLNERGEIAPRFNTRHDLAHDGRWGNVVTVNARTNEELVVAAGERIRLRLVNVANGRVFTPDLSQLDAKVIAVDGRYAARPLDPSRFDLAPGNRLDVDVTIPAERRGQRIVISDVFTNGRIRLAEIRVTDDVVATPDFASPAAAYVPEWPSAAGAPVRTEFRLDARAGGPLGIEWTINDRAFAHEDHHLPHEPHRLPYGEWSKVRFTNASFRLHPMHIHGVFFKVLTRNGTPVDEPYWRDTVLLRRKDTVDVGLVPLDRGTWMAHCHILEHAEAGMMTLVEVR